MFIDRCQPLLRRYRAFGNRRRYCHLGWVRIPDSSQQRCWQTNRYHINRASRPRIVNIDKRHICCIIPGMRACGNLKLYYYPSAGRLLYLFKVSRLIVVQTTSWRYNVRQPARKKQPKSAHAYTRLLVQRRYEDIMQTTTTNYPVYQALYYTRKIILSKVLLFVAVIGSCRHFREANACHLTPEMLPICFNGKLAARSSCVTLSRLKHASHTNC